jgi:hypothetical protein
VKLPVGNYQSANTGAVYKSGFITQSFKGIEQVYQSLHGILASPAAVIFLIPPFTTAASIRLPTLVSLLGFLFLHSWRLLSLIPGLRRALLLRLLLDWSRVFYMFTTTLRRL